MNRPFMKIGIGLASIGVVVLVILLNTFWKEPVPVRDQSHCPECGAEFPPAAQVSGKCPYCELKKRSSAGKKNDQEDKSSPGVAAIVPVILFSCIGLSLGTLTFRLFLRRRKRKSRMAFRYFRCSKCKRKLRFEACRAGKPGKCPTCKSACTFPTADVVEEFGGRLLIGDRWDPPN